jgi:predicted RND superfamily exporter protein
VESDEVRYFKKQNAFRRATENIQRDLGGITSLDIVIETDEPDSLKDPSLLKDVEALQQFCEQDDLVSYTLSLPDLIKRINYVLHDSDAAYDRLPGEVELVTYETYEEVDGQEQLVGKTEEVSGFEQIAQFLLLYDMSGGDATEQYVDDAYQYGRVIVRLKDMSSQRLERLLDKLEPYVAEHFPETVRVRYANHYIRIVMTGLIIDSQIYSLLTVLITITILMSIIFRSPVVGLITSIPVFIAVLLNFAVMWIFGVTLNVGTSIIASVGMGVGIDYTIHFFSRFRFILKETGEYDSALKKAIIETSRAILSNATAVGLGFLVLLFSEYQVIGHIGWITCLSMFTTALSSLIVLPSLLSLVKPKVKM